MIIIYDIYLIKFLVIVLSVFICLLWNMYSLIIFSTRVLSLRKGI